MIRLNADHLFVPILLQKNGFNCSRTMLSRYLEHSWLEKYNESKNGYREWISGISMIVTDVGDGYACYIWRRW